MVRGIATALIVAAFGSTAEAQNYGNWRHESQSSELDDTTTEYFGIETSNQIPNSIGMMTRGMLMVSCKQNTTVMLVNINDFMGSDPVAVRYRVDKGKVRTSIANVSQDGRAYGWWGGTGVPLLKAMKGGKKLVVSAAPWGEGPKEAVFDIEGVDAVVERLGKACGWQ